MSITAHLFVLFKSAPSADRLQEIAEVVSNRVGLPATDFTAGHERLKPVVDADLWADVAEDGSLHYLDDSRSGKLIGAPTLDGRLYEIGYLTRIWNVDIPQGPAMTYALTQLVLLGQPDVEGVWYTDHYFQDGALIPAATRETVHRMIDEFIAIGEISYGKPTQYIRTENGVINI